MNVGRARLDEVRDGRGAARLHVGLVQDAHAGRRAVRRQRHGGGRDGDLGEAERVGRLRAGERRAEEQGRREGGVEAGAHAKTRASKRSAGPHARTDLRGGTAPAPLFPEACRGSASRAGLLAHGPVCAEARDVHRLSAALPWPEPSGRARRRRWRAVYSCGDSSGFARRCRSIGRADRIPFSAPACGAPATVERTRPTYDDRPWAQRRRCEVAPRRGQSIHARAARRPHSPRAVLPVLPDSIRDLLPSYPSARRCGPARRFDRRRLGLAAPRDGREKRFDDVPREIPDRGPG